MGRRPRPETGADASVISFMAVKLHHVLYLAILAVGLQACGPVEYMNQVSRKASSQVEAAKAVRADKYAPYYYTLAVEYLHKAREEAAHSDYQSANRFGKRATEAARKARIEALKQAKLPRPAQLGSDESDEIKLVDPSDEAEDADNPLKENH